MTDHRLTPALLEIKRASVTASGEFVGYASTWDGQPDSYGDIIRRGAFLPALSAHKSANTMPAMLWSHDTSTPIGKWLDFREDEHGLLATGKLTLGTQKGAEAYALLKDDAIALSVGFILADGGATRKAGYREITRVARLLEVSLVGLPANSNAKVTQIKKPDTVRDFQQALRGMGFSNRESKFVTTHGFRDLLAPGERSQLDLLIEKIEQLQRIIEAKL